MSTRKRHLQPMTGFAVRPWMMCGALLLGVALSACARYESVMLPATTSSPALSPTNGLMAGFGRHDITPPAGIPIAGWGSDGSISAGFRHRLYVRAMVLQDREGERIAFALADLLAVSPLLHRRAAAELAKQGVGLGADRLVVAATHTHSGPGNFFESKVYNDQSSVLPGFDNAMADFIVEGIVEAVSGAFADLQPAVAAWDTIHVYGYTKNRSLEAFRSNPESRERLRNEMTQREMELAAIDPVWSMLRVDQCEDGWVDCRPRGAFSVFAIHPTGYPAANDLFDGDISALVERAVEQHIAETRSATGDGDNTAAFHLFANGAEGDLSPDHDPGTRCEVYESLTAGSTPSGPRRPLLPEEWYVDPDRLAECLDTAHRSVERIGRALGRKAVRVYDSAGKSLSRNLAISRAFVTRNLRKPDSLATYCEEPRFGSAAVGGAEDGRTKFHHWSAGWLLPSGFEEGKRATAVTPRGCHEEKRIAFGLLQSLLSEGLNFPRYAQFSVVRIGDTVIATVPAEPTVIVGARIKERLLAASIPGVTTAAVLGLANGYLDYVSTREEYRLQHYEGAATIYGPHTGQSIVREVGVLAASIAEDAPIVVIDSMSVGPGPERPYLKRALDREADRSLIRSIEDASCTPRGLTASWIDDRPGALMPSEIRLLEVQRRGRDGAWVAVADDDDSSVVVRVVRTASSESALWEMTWEPLEETNGALVHRVPLGEYRVVIRPEDQENGSGSGPVASIMCQ